MLVLYRVRIASLPLIRFEAFRITGNFSAKALPDYILFVYSCRYREKMQEVNTFLTDNHFPKDLKVLSCISLALHAYCWITNTCFLYLLAAQDSRLLRLHLGALS